MKLTDIDRTPGKFEGEPEYLKTLWDSVLDGASDDVIDDGDRVYSVFRLSADDKRDYATDADIIIVWESDQGFVNMRHLDSAEFAALCANFDTDTAGQDQELTRS
jgi:hypothetical protein